MELDIHRVRLLKKARFITSNEMDAEDLVQETFVQAVILHKDYKEEGKMFAWLCKIMSNVNSNLSRKATAIYVDFNDERFQRLISDRELPAIPTTKPALS